MHTVIIHENLKNKLESLPTNPGVYQFKDAAGHVLYVGKAINLRNRVRQYFSGRKDTMARIKIMVDKIDDIEIIVTDSEVEALILEASLIKKIKPRYNIDLKDDKTYPFIMITNEQLPRVLITRRIIRDGSKYFGPYTDVKNMRSALKLVRDIFKVRSCNYYIDEEVIKNKKVRLCLEYHIKKCDGPCEGLISIHEYNEMIKEVAQVLKGKTTALIGNLEIKMKNASENLRFEEAAELRDRIGQLRVYNEKQKIIDSDGIDRDLFAIASDVHDACGIVFNVREGKIVGKKHTYIKGIENKNEGEVIEHFIERYYIDTDDFPDQIFLAGEPENMEIIRSWLKQKSGKEVDIIIPKIGNKAKLMEMCFNNAKLLLGELKLQKLKKKLPGSILALQRDLKLKIPPRKIECFDISNIQGSDNVGSMVVFLNGISKKTEYRKYKLRKVQGADDFASMREIIERRYRRLLSEKKELPDLIIVDGGKGQLSSAVEVLKKLGLKGSKYSENDQDSKSKNIPVIGLAKRLEEVFIPESSDAQTIPKTSSGLRLLRQIRDEAHRFAINYHRTLRSRRVLNTELDFIQGISEKRAKKLLDIFGSVNGVRHATEKQLAEIVGVKVAGRIKEYFGNV